MWDIHKCLFLSIQGKSLAKKKESLIHKAMQRFIKETGDYIRMSQPHDRVSVLCVCFLIYGSWWASDSIHMTRAQQVWWRAAAELCPTMSKGNCEVFLWGIYSRRWTQRGRLSRWMSLLIHTRAPWRPVVTIQTLLRPSLHLSFMALLKHVPAEVFIPDLWH